MGAFSLERGSKEVVLQLSRLQHSFEILNIVT